MQTWRKGDVAVEDLELPLPADRINQPLRLYLGLYDVPTGQRLRILSFNLSGTTAGSLVDGRSAFEIHPGGSQGLRQ